VQQRFVMDLTQLRALLQHRRLQIAPEGKLVAGNLFAAIEKLLAANKGRGARRVGRGARPWRRLERRQRVELRGGFLR
jgi:hypothetical protein